MGSSVLLFTLIVASGAGAAIPQSEVKHQETVFGQWWYEEFEWNFDALPAKGNVPEQRIPYSGYIYLDNQGGTADVLRKYDLAVNRNGSLPATSWEYSDTAAARNGGQRRGLFGRRWQFGSENDWFGHCNGWTAAAIRHAEPQHSVRAYGTEFTPSDIKGLLAEVYMYNEIEMLAGFEQPLNAGTLHAILANWLGRGAHPVAMDSDPTKEKWNYPIYAYNSGFAKRSEREVEVRTNIAYSKDSADREYDKSPAIRKMKSFHYMLNLNERGEIVGGYYYSDSDRIDFLWVPVSPKEPGTEGNEAGNPHLDVAKVMDIWRQSVPTPLRRKWVIVDPAVRDRAVEVTDPTRLLPRNIRIVPPARTAQSGGDDVAR